MLGSRAGPAGQRGAASAAHALLTCGLAILCSCRRPYRLQCSLHRWPLTIQPTALRVCGRQACVFTATCSGSRGCRCACVSGLAILAHGSCATQGSSTHNSRHLHRAPQCIAAGTFRLCIRCIAANAALDCRACRGTRHSRLRRNPVHSAHRRRCVGLSAASCCRSVFCICPRLQHGPEGRRTAPPAGQPRASVFIGRGLDGSHGVLVAREACTIPAKPTRTRAAFNLCRQPDAARALTAEASFLLVSPTDCS